MSTTHPYNQFVGKLVHISAGPLNTLGRVEEIDWDNGLLKLIVATQSVAGVSFMPSYITISAISIITEEPGDDNLEE